MSGKKLLLGFPLIVAFLLFSPGVYSQLTVNPGSGISLTPTQFAQTYLVGTGVTITNATFNGSSAPLNGSSFTQVQKDQIGSFTATGGAYTELGIAGGVMLSSGVVQNAIAGGPTTSATSSGSDPDLVILAGTGVNDKAVLEFDFVPETDLITFRYVFTSNEFDGFCNSYNDAFGLFISGPGISGGMGFQNNAENIARLPDNTNYVTINNICAVDQGNHGQGKYSWWNGVKTYFSRNRFTYVYSANYTVQCGQTYHMKFAIADAGDSQYDSDVFIEQNSFSSNNVTPSTNFSNPATGSLLVPGCSNANLSYTIPMPKTTSITIDLGIDPSGTATQADILPNPFPLTIILPAGATETTSIFIQALPAAVPGPDKTLIIKASVTTCAASSTVTSTYTIRYNPPLTLSAPPVNLCSGGVATLTATAGGGQVFVPSNDYHFLWSTGSTSPTITLNPGPGNHPYSVAVTDACGQTVSTATSVNVGTTPGPAGLISGPATVCSPANVVFSVPPIPGADTYFWTLPPGASVVAGNNTNSITVSFTAAAVPGIVSVTGHSLACGDGPASVRSVTVHPAPEPAGPISGLNQLCQGTLSVIYNIPTVNYATSYQWQVPPGVTITAGSGTNTITCQVTTSAISGTVTVSGYNSNCNLGPSAMMTVTIGPIPGAAGTIVSAGGSVVCQRMDGVAYSIATIANAAQYIWTYSGSGVTLINNGAQLLMGFTATATSGSLTVKGNNACGDGTVSPPFNITVRLKPTVGFSSCNTLKTTKNGRPIVLKGGTPLGTGGVYSGIGVTMLNPGRYQFDPSNSAVMAGSSGNVYSITYTYTNIEGCSDEKQIDVTVFPSNASVQCPGTVTDYRDNQVYNTFQAGGRCWMAANLNYGTYTQQNQPQTDNCTIEKYCKDNSEPECTESGGFYQWDEIMEYQGNSGFQDICPPGWHLPTVQEWNDLIDAYSGNPVAGGFLKDLLSSNGFHGILKSLYYQNTTWAFGNGTPTGTMFWTSGNYSRETAVARGLASPNPSISLYNSSKANAFNVRCVKN